MNFVAVVNRKNIATFENLSEAIGFGAYVSNSCASTENLDIISTTTGEVLLTFSRGYLVYVSNSVVYDVNYDIKVRNKIVKEIVGE